MAAEHAASAAVARWFGTAFEAAAANRPDIHPILVGLPPGARHELGGLAFATACRRAGLAARYLGADLPAAEWARAARDTDAATAVIGVPTAADADAARAVARALRRASPGISSTAGEGPRNSRSNRPARGAHRCRRRHPIDFGDVGTWAPSRAPRDHRRESRGGPRGERRAGAEAVRRLGGGGARGRRRVGACQALVSRRVCGRRAGRVCHAQLGRRARSAEHPRSVVPLEAAHRRAPPGPGLRDRGRPAGCRPRPTRGRHRPADQPCCRR